MAEKLEGREELISLERRKCEREEKRKKIEQKVRERKGEKKKRVYYNWKERWKKDDFIISISI